MILMMRATLRAKGQFTLPDDIRKAAHLESGDEFIDALRARAHDSKQPSN